MVAFPPESLEIPNESSENAPFMKKIDEIAAENQLFYEEKHVCLEKIANLEKKLIFLKNSMRKALKTVFSPLKSTSEKLADYCSFKADFESVFREKHEKIAKNEKNKANPER